MNKEKLVIEFSKWIDQQSDNANFTVFNGVEWNLNIYNDDAMLRRTGDLR